METNTNPALTEITIRALTASELSALDPNDTIVAGEIARRAENMRVAAVREANLAKGAPARAAKVARREDIRRSRRYR